MRKFLVSLIILLALGGVIFYFGWVQFQIPPDTVGIIFTKTSGYDEAPVIPGTFVWRWERLLPTNMTIYTLPLEKQKSVVSVSGNLPSSDLYKSVLPGEPLFDYHVSVSILYSIKPDRLPELFRDNRVGNDLMAQIRTELEEKGGAILTGYIYESLTRNTHLMDSIYDIQSHFSEEFPFIEIYSLNPTTLDLPDIQLYLEAKGLYSDLVRQKNSILQQETVKAVTSRTLSEERLEILRLYGSLLEDYPVILDYLALGLDQDFLFQSLGLEPGEQ